MLLFVFVFRVFFSFKKCIPDLFCLQLLLKVFRHFSIVPKYYLESLNNSTDLVASFLSILILLKRKISVIKGASNRRNSCCHYKPLQFCVFFSNFKFGSIFNTFFPFCPSNTLTMSINSLPVKYVAISTVFVIIVNSSITLSTFKVCFMIKANKKK